MRTSKNIIAFESSESWKLWTIKEMEIEYNNQKKVKRVILLFHLTVVIVKRDSPGQNQFSSNR
jgi:hypothetical protein